MNAMRVAIITGSAGLVGSESGLLFHEKGFNVVGIDNDMRAQFFGAGASTAWRRDWLCERLERYRHYSGDIRDKDLLERVFSEYGSDIAAVIHTAAQPSHDWSASDPWTDFSVNASGTLSLLEATRRHCPRAAFVFTSTNKVYGDTPNLLPLQEEEQRWEVSRDHPYFDHGIDEQMSIDQSKHSPFGASKVAADVMVQEYGRYFGLRTACFRGGCLTGPAHAGAELHGFLSYLTRCVVSGTPYVVHGYKGKQVRDNIHARDLANAFYCFSQSPRKGEVYNIGGGRHLNCSVLEAISLCEQIAGKKLNWSYSDQARSGDHVWWISDVRKFRSHYPEWDYKYTLEETLTEIYDAASKRPRVEQAATCR
jgi:CDP-paratose 2-epimerase